MHKMSKRQAILRKLSKRDRQSVEATIKEMRETAKKDPEVIKKFKEYDVPIDEIDKVQITFCRLEVSAKTKNKKIYLNEAMLQPNSKVKDPTHYLVHELVHYLQQSTGKNITKHKAEDSYLDKPTEQEAFQSQIDYMEREESPQEAERYVEDLLDHHDVHGPDRKEKKEELLDK